jgi:hypothetical protein
MSVHPSGSVPAADDLRRVSHNLVGWTTDNAAIEAAADLLEVIDALHHPIGLDGKPSDVCTGCGRQWPCLEHRLLHPEVQP